MPPIIPSVTDEDVAWIAEIMKLDGLDPARVAFMKKTGTFDVSACPGSGKTTLIVAKLAIMAKKWPHKTSGICVLSHTNVAREEIQKKLGHTPVGHRLMCYPHFIDTIHTFANRFLALPYLQSNGYPAPLIDDDVAKSFRRKVLPSHEQRKYEIWLNRRHASVDDITFLDKNFSVSLGGRAFPTAVHTQTYQKALNIVKSSAEAGRFKYEEMFVWAEYLLEANPDISNALSQRFPLVLMDEMQDTSQRQAAFLHSIFNRNVALSSVQRVGDPNQEIFKNETDRNTGETFPDSDPERTITVASSRRFGKIIAALAEPHAAVPIEHGLVGAGPCHSPELADHGQNLIIVFPDNNAAGVLDKFGQHLLETFDDQTLAFGPITAIGGVHKPSVSIDQGHANYPRSVGHYWADYSPEKAKYERHPQSLIGCVHLAQSMVQDGSEIGAAVSVFVSGLSRLARTIGTPRDELNRKRKHKAIRSILEINPELLTRYDEFVDTHITNKAQIPAELWATSKQELLTISKALCNGETNSDDANNFLRWEEPQVLPLTELDGANSNENVCTITSGERQVSIALGSIHQAKGQTHFATLLLSTFQHSHSSEKIFNWLTGENSGGDGQGIRNLSRLKRTFVAMTRPTHLIAVAVRESALGVNRDEALAKLKNNGWDIADICE